VRVLASPAGVAFRPFAPPFSRREIETFQPLLAELGDHPPEQNEAQQAQVRELGGRLFQALFHESVRTVLDESYQLAYQARARLRLRLHTTTMLELAHWPWEFLYDPYRQEFPALAVQSPFVRYIDLMHQIVLLKAAAPLRLLVVIASPGGYPLLNIEREWTNLLDTLDHLAVEGKLILELVLKPTLHDLQRRLRQGQYHLLHFVGHGVYQSQAQEHQLIFEDEIGRSRPVSGQHLGALLRDHFPMRLVTLQACTGAKPARQNPYLGVAQSLVQRGLPAVVAMQAPLANRTALTFADEFDTAIANRVPIDVAMTEARRAVWINNRDIAWSTLALLSRAPDGQIFDPAWREENTTQRRPNFVMRKP
jgi:hypothetical protein